MIFDKDQVDSARRIKSELNICLVIQKTSNSKQLFHVQDRISYTIISRIKFSLIKLN